MSRLEQNDEELTALGQSFERANAYPVSPPRWRRAGWSGARLVAPSAHRRGLRDQAVDEAASPRPRVGNPEQRPLLGALALGENAELTKHVGLVPLRPLLDDLAVEKASEVEAGHLRPLVGRTEAHEVAAMGSARPPEGEIAAALVGRRALSQARPS
jgi:hypothetical protein